MQTDVSLIFFSWAQVQGFSKKLFSSIDKEWTLAYVGSGVFASGWWEWDKPLSLILGLPSALADSVWSASSSVPWASGQALGSTESDSQIS